MRLLWILLLLVLGQKHKVSGQSLDSTVPANFYPFGPDRDDDTAPVNDDGSTGEVDISVPFPYFDQLHSSIFINTNGAVSFLEEVSQFTPDPFPLAGNRRLVAPFWADVDTTVNDGRVYWRETQDSSILTRATQDIRNAFVSQTSFTASWVLVVTWYQVSYFGGSSSTPVNTFQAVLVTNGRHSFAIYNYGDITWTTGTASGGNSATGLGGTPAQVGFNAGDGVRFASVPGSRTADIVNIETQSNVGESGRFMFRIDEADVEAGGCNTAGSLAVGPRFVTPLGGRKINIAGPCFDADNQTVICRFGDIDVQGDVISETQAMCVTPLTFSVGRQPLLLSTNGAASFDFEGIIWFLTDEAEKYIVQQVNPDAWLGYDLYQSLVIEWDASILRSSSVQVQFITFRVDASGEPEQISITLSESTPNSGSFQLQDRLEFAQNLELATYGTIRVSEKDVLPHQVQSLWSSISTAGWYTSLFFHEVAIRGDPSLISKKKKVPTATLR